jgi:hypothetical protein
VPPTVLRTLAVSSYGRILRALWPAFGITAEDARETIRDLGPIARPLVEGEALFARDTHAVLCLGPARPRGSAA